MSVQQQILEIGKSECKNEKSKSYNKPLYVFILEINGWSDDWCMVLVQSYPNCKTSIELLKYEREHNDIYNPELNVRKPCRKEGEIKDNRKEYQNTEKFKEHLKEYRQNNAKKIKKYNKVYQKENADKLKEYKRSIEIKMLIE